MNLLKPIEDENEKSSLTLDLITNVSGVIGAAIVGDPTGMVAAAIPRITNEVIHRIILPLTSPSESKRLYQWGKQAVNGIAQRSKNEEFRKDGFFEETPTNRSNFEEVVESTLKKVMEATEEPKIKFMANLTENVHFDEDLDIDTYRQKLKDLDDLSYRQLCIIRLITLYGNKEVDICSIDDMELLSQSERIRFYSIGRDYVNLMDNRYIIGGDVPTLNDNPCLSSPGSGWFSDKTEQLHSFANLDQIPDGDIERTFSLWNVRRRKSEEDSL